MFSDTEIANEMKKQLVKIGVVSERALNNLIDNGYTTENNIREQGVSINQNKFKEYWKKMEKWVNSKGGDFANLSGTKAQGREGGIPKGFTARPLYNDAFKDVNTHILSKDFKPIKAISNQLRFVNIYQDINQILGQGSSNSRSHTSSDRQQVKAPSSRHPSSSKKKTGPSSKKSSSLRY